MNKRQISLWVQTRSRQPYTPPQPHRQPAAAAAAAAHAIAGADAATVGGALRAAVQARTVSRALEGSRHDRHPTDMIKVKKGVESL